MSGEEFRKPIRLARAALDAAMADKLPRALDIVKRISDECGGEGVAIGITYWCHAMTEHAYGGKPSGPVKLSFAQVDAAAEGHREPPPHVVWAGQLTAAYAAGDDGTYDALINALPHDEAEVGRHVGQVLKSSALALTMLPRGYLNPSPP